MKMKKMIYFLFALLFLSANGMKAQVAIGTENPNMEPHTGAILDLGQVKNKDLGLLLPKVALTAHDDWEPVLGEKVDGMMVYNDSPCAINGLNGKGAYVWYDDSWHLLMKMKSAVASFTCGDKLTDIEGNTYNTGDFGIAGCWMTENLKVTKYADGCTAIDYKNGVNNNMNIAVKEYAYPYNDAANKATLGLLYTWAAASGRTGITDNEANDPDQTQYQGACPDGWHLPSDYEWSQLEEVIATDAVHKYSSTGATTWEASYYTSILDGGRGQHGQKMKASSVVSDLEVHGTSNDPDNNGFSVKIAGIVAYDNNATVNVDYTYFWCSSNRNATSSAWYRYLGRGIDWVRRNNTGKYQCISVRCKKNQI